MHIHPDKKVFQIITLIFMAVFACSTLGSTAVAQKDKKKKKDTVISAEGDKPNVTLNDEQQIDLLVAEMLGAWQLGDVEKLHKAYAEDVSFVNGGWAAPIVGWPNYLAIYKQQYSRMQRVRMDRFSTFIKVSGNVGWACYQWEFEAAVDNTPSASRGQTTLIVQKRDNHWLIVHNHTSLVQSLTPGSGNTAPVNQSPAKP
jgi:ketosteroid isomerase-like protein